MSVNEKLTLQDLVDLLAEKQGLTKKDADIFLRELIGLISETIEKEEFVRIKKFGTFKRTKIKARKSIDVNTNESIEIPAHYRLTFVPDKELRDAVNRPFSHYESVLIEEGSPIEDEENDIENIIIDDNLSEKIKQVKVISYPKGMEIPDSIPEHVFNQQEGEAERKIEKNNKEDKQESRQSSTEEENTAILSSNITSIKKTEEEITTLASTESEEEIPAKKITSLTPTSQTEDQEEIEDTEEPAKRRKLIPILLICLLILAVIGIYWWYPSKTEPTTSLITEETHQNKESDDNTTNKDIALAGDSTNIENTEMSADNEQITEEEAQYQETEIQYNDTMRKLGQKYFGHRSFWVYIYEENKNIIENPNAVPIGTKIRIPPASKYNIDPKNPESIKKARELEEKLFQKFDI